MCTVKFKNYKLLAYDLLRFVTCKQCSVGLLIFCTVLLTLWFLSLNKWKQQKQMFDVEVFRMTIMNSESFTGQWWLFSAWHAMLELHLSLRTGSLRSWNDLHILYWHPGGDIHTRLCCQTTKRFSMILSMAVNYSLNRYCHSSTGFCCCCWWWPHRLLICNSWFV